MRINKHCRQFPKDRRKVSHFRQEQKKSGGSNTFYQLKKGAATTLCNSLSIEVPVKRVVAVAAVLQNSGRGRKVQLKKQTMFKMY